MGACRLTFFENQNGFWEKIIKTLTADTADGFIENIPAKLTTIQALLDDMVDDNFLILEDSTTQNYIQTIPDDKDGFVVEVRHYLSDDENDFKHHRKICDDFSKVFDYFEQFFDDKPINTSDWQDITQDFKHRIYVKCRINQLNDEYYLMLYDDTHEYLMEQISKFSDKQDYLTICLNDENSEQSLTIYPQNHDYKINLNHQEPIGQKIISDINHLTKIIVNFLNDDISDWIN